jgi:general secretion pathway protein E
MTAPPVHLPWAFSAAHGVVAEPARPEAIAAGPAAALAVAVRAGTDPLALAEARRALRRPLSVRVVDGPRFETLLAQAREGAGEDAHHVADEIAIGAELASLPLELPAAAELLDDEHDAPVIRLVNALLARAARDGASDIHVEPFEERSVVRMRLDGTLRDLVEPHRALHAALVSRVKIMARLDIAERRLPQDGRIALRVAGRPLDVRVSTIPTAHGERVVLRLLDRQAARLDLATLGMDAATLARLDRLIRAPHGIVLVTGPTGSGKTTTLYAALRRLDDRRRCPLRRDAQDATGGSGLCAGSGVAAQRQPRGKDQFSRQPHGLFRAGDVR